ncbi:MBL fold metallo-hydrolase [Tomitella cavernea]|nr:MBL fold metallo-hydrolase [Tomitella cavernea]
MQAGQDTNAGAGQDPVREDGPRQAGGADTGAVDLGDGVWQLAVPFPNPLKATLVYAMESPGGLILVDAGWDGEQSWAGLTSAVEATGHAMADIEGVVLTHFHPDHTGLCGRVREASGAWIAMHDSDFHTFDLMTGSRDAAWLDEQTANLRAAGASEEDLAAFREGSEMTPPTTRASRPDRLLADDEKIPLAGRTLRTVWTPGHTPGHVCFALDSADMVFTGDHVLQKTTPHVGNFVFPLEERDALDEFMQSQRRIAAMGITRAFGAHGTPIADLAGRSAQLLAHHEERLDDLCRDLENGALTLWQIAARMQWYRPWNELPVMGKQMALSEAAAHLRYLVGDGRVVQLPASDPVRFAIAGGA